MAKKGKARLKVGITIGPAQDAQALLWANGLSQNIVYLALLLQRLPIVSELGLICDVQPHAVATAYGLPVWGVEQAAAHCDVVIELGARSFGAAQVDTLRAHGGKIVSFEALAHGGQAAEQLVKHKFDAAWLLPQHWHMCRSYCALLGSANVQEIPVLWDPVFLNHTAALMRKNVFWREPDGGKYALGCFDPNINVLKTFHLPLLVTEEAYRIDDSRIDKLLLFGAMRLKDSRHVTEMILATDIGQAGRISLEERHSLVHVMGSNVHAVVTHQWENNRNYLYYEVLYLGWPLVHNVPSLSDAGYFYEQFNPQDGGRALQEALKGHPSIRVKQRDAIREALWQVSVDNPANQDRYSELLLQVMG